MKWSNPPTRIWHSIAADVEALKENPGRWALVREDGAASIVAAYKRYGCEARSHRNGNVRGRADVYARWPEATK